MSDYEPSGPEWDHGRITTTSDYEPYGPEWVEVMLKTKKQFLISMVKEARAEIEALNKRWELLKDHLTSERSFYVDCDAAEEALIDLGKKMILLESGGEDGVKRKPIKCKMCKAV